MVPQRSHRNSLVIAADQIDKALLAECKIGGSNKDSMWLQSRANNCAVMFLFYFTLAFFVSTARRILAVQTKVCKRTAEQCLAKLTAHIHAVNPAHWPAQVRADNAWSTCEILAKVPCKWHVGQERIKQSNQTHKNTNKNQSEPVKAGGWNVPKACS